MCVDTKYVKTFSQKINFFTRVDICGINLWTSLCSLIILGKIVTYLGIRRSVGRIYYDPQIFASNNSQIYDHFITTVVANR